MLIDYSSDAERRYVLKSKTSAVDAVIEGLEVIKSEKLNPTMTFLFTAFGGCEPVEVFSYFREDV